jgi:DNA-binding CsgD family transcriptional regulator
MPSEKLEEVSIPENDSKYDIMPGGIKERVAKFTADTTPRSGADLALRLHSLESECISLLSPRELDVFILLGLGYSNARIGRWLGITERTVKTHVGHIIIKLGLESRLQIGLVAQVHIQSALPLLAAARTAAPDARLTAYATSAR